MYLLQASARTDVKGPGRIYSAYHDWLGQMMVGVHHRGFIDYRYFTARRSKTISERSRFEQTVLLLQGGGVFGSYQAGVYQALAEANLHPD
jgi:hypothetical protein